MHNATRYIQNAKFVCICSEPSDASPRHGIEAVRIRLAPGWGQELPRPLRRIWRVPAEIGDFIRAIGVMKTLDALIVTGTGIISDTGEGSFGFPYELLKWSLATKLSGGRLYYLSVGVEDVDRPLARVLMKAALHLADYRGYRDSLSRDRLLSLGFAATGDAVYPDLAFSLPQSIAKQSEIGSSERPVVGVGLYSYRNCGAAGGDDLTAYEGYLDIICSFIEWLLDHEYAVRVILGDLAYDSQVPVDIRQRLERRGRALDSGVYSDAPALSFEQLLSQLAQVKFVVATRFHTVLLALLLGRPALSVSYDAKNDVLMAEMGLGRYCQTLESFDLDVLVDQFVHLEKNAAPLILTMQRRAAEFRSQLEDQYRIVFGRDAQLPDSGPSQLG